MKKFFLFIVVLFFCVNLCLSEDISDDLKKEQMGSFMGIKWGMVLKGFRAYINEKTGLNPERKKGASRELDELYAMRKYTLNNFLILDFYVDIVFLFKNTPERLEQLRAKYKKEWRVRLKLDHSKNLFLNSVFINCTPNHFEELFFIFKIKYGEPTSYNETEIQNRMGAKFIQKEARWINEKLKRKIVMEKYANSINESSIYFLPHDKDYIKKRMEYLKAAANRF
ncbi:MAG: hypothetical protein KAT34_03120 [Candidatus Aminicenantes bacterium]|nr:hypothetical protein [Candidatus Aminicenantes bacterium]